VINRHVCLGVLVVLTAGCATARASEQSSAFNLPVAPHATPLATGILYTSPDGGIYKNPDSVQVTMVAHLSGEALVRRLGAAASSWTQLERLGDFTFVGLTLRNNGRAWSDAQLNATQIASDFAPAGTASGGLRRYYHPMFALALLSEKSSDANCTLHLDSGESTRAVLVYPPLRPTTHIVWGIFRLVALEADVGGGLTDKPERWNVTACARPAPSGA
jgi:hypothetical protein